MKTATETIKEIQRNGQPSRADECKTFGIRGELENTDDRGQNTEDGLNNE